MIKLNVVINNKSGLAMRHAIALVKKVKTHDAIVMVKKNGHHEIVSAHCPLELLSLAAEPGTELNFEIDGNDKEKLLPILEKFFNHEIHFHD